MMTLRSRWKRPEKDLAMGSWMQCRRLFQENGIPVNVVSTGGTGTDH
jgi:hypothetical protein